MLDIFYEIQHWIYCVIQSVLYTVCLLCWAYLEKGLGTPFLNYEHHHANSDMLPVNA